MFGITISDIPGILAGRSEGIFVFFVKISDLLDLCWIYAPPGNPNRLKMMPRGIGSISTPADFLLEIF